MEVLESPMIGIPKLPMSLVQYGDPKKEYPLYCFSETYNKSRLCAELRTTIRQIY